MSILTMLKWSLVVLILFPSVASAQSVQTFDSEGQLASVLCRNPKEDASNELLLEKNAQLVNITLWNALLDCASSAQRHKSDTKSLEVYKLVLRVANRLNKPELIANTYYYVGRTYSALNDVAKSIEAYETSRRLFEQAGLERSLSYVLADLGRLYFIAQGYEKAESYSKQSLALAQQLKSSPTEETLAPIEYRRAQALHTLGQIDLSRGNYADALNKLCEALALFERLNGTGSSYNIHIADVLIALARVYGERGNYDEASSCLTKAHQVSRDSGDKNTRANILTAQGSLYLEQENYQSARSHFNASLAVYRSLGNTIEEARVLLNLALIEQREGDPDRALELFHRTLDAATNAKLVDIQIAAGEGLGVVLTAKRDFSHALLAINQSLELARKVSAKTRETELLWRAAQISYAMRHYRESAALAEQALTLARTLGLPKLAYFAAAALGEAYAADDRVELAISTLKEAINQVEELWDRVVGLQESRDIFFEDKIGPYHTLAKLLTKQDKILEALLYAERAKGRLLLEAVRRDTRDLINLLTPADMTELVRLHDKVAAAYQGIQSASGHDPDGELNTQLKVARREFESFERTLVAAHPELLLRAGPAQPLTDANLNSLVRADDLTYLEYVVEGDNIGLFILRRNGVTSGHNLKYIQLPVNADDLRRKVNKFHSSLAERSPDYAALAHDLYRLLIEPATAELQNGSTVCIIPDEFLWTLPFQALKTTSGNYLIQDYSLYYAPSLTVMKEMVLRRPQQTSNESLIAFANPVIESREEVNPDLQAISETEIEVATVARTVRTPKKRVLLGPQADEKTFKAVAGQYATIHVATHGVLDDRDPLNSYLLLTKSDGWENDGLLHAREILAMQLDADLVVLSACETGSGRISAGEGVIGMSWAFLFAGGRSVVVSQWKVNSTSTAQLMKNFYEALATQKALKALNKSQALRQASLRLLKDPRYRHPFYWAGFVLVSSN